MKRRACVVTGLVVTVLALSGCNLLPGYGGKRTADAWGEVVVQTTDALGSRTVSIPIDATCYFDDARGAISVMGGREAAYLTYAPEIVWEFTIGLRGSELQFTANGTFDEADAPTWSGSTFEFSNVTGRVFSWDGETTAIYDETAVLNGSITCDS